MLCQEEDRHKISWGNKAEIPVEITTLNEPLDLTGYKVLFTLKKDVNTTNDNFAAFQGEATIDPDQVTNKGKAKMFLSEENTKITPGIYKADFKIFDDNDELLGNATIFDIEILHVVTQRGLPE